MTDINLFPTAEKDSVKLGGVQGFCDNNTMASVIKSVTMVVGGKNMFKIAWRHLWTTPTNNHVKVFFPGNCYF